MSTWREQIFGLEPFEESQGGSSYTSSTPPDAGSLNMDSQDYSPTKSSRSKRRSLFRKPTKRASTVPHPTAPGSGAKSVRSSRSQSDKSRDPETDTLFTNANGSTDTFTPLIARSIIPDALDQLPSWYNKEGEVMSASAHQFRARYPIHNPGGPRSYKNHHLYPPSSNRPPSVFSPAFPPMAAESAQEPGWMPAPSRSPSGSPLPTPSSSQSRIQIQEPAGKRTRKLSNAAHDNVDLLDVSDPWGTNWHHQSPYDVGGLNAEKVSPEGLEQGRMGSRSRMSSLTGGQRHKIVTPSPLSQSTSALHLQPPDPEDSSTTRKHSKHRKHGLRGVFDGSPHETDNHAKSASAPATPVDPNLLAADGSTSVGRKLSKLNASSLSASSARASVSITSTSPIHMTEKKEKRGSVLGRFARRFSVMRRGTRAHSRESGSDSWQNVSIRPSVETLDKDKASTQSAEPRVPSPEKPSMHPRQSTDASKRVPPPSLDTEAVKGPDSALTPPSLAEREAGERISYSSVETPFSIGKLTIANPDAAGSVESSPAPRNLSFLPDAVASGTLQSKLRTFEGTHPIIDPATASHTRTIVESPTQLTPSTSLPSAEPSSSTTVHTHQQPPAPAHTAIPAHLQATNLVNDHSLPPTPVPNDSPLPAPVNSDRSASYTDDSPLSKASMIANPPTPHLLPTQVLHVPSPYVLSSGPIAPTPIFSTVTSPVPTLHSTTNGVHSSSRDSSPTKKNSRHKKSSSSVKRETETFRLMRSPSTGNVQSTGESFVVQGEQWQVVEDTESPKKSKSIKGSESRRRSSSQRELRQQGKAEATNQASSSRPDSADRASGTGRIKERKRRSNTLDSVSSKPVNREHLERRPSASARPTSEVPSVADLNAVRAREVWEMDRLFKGRSMAYGLEGPQLVYAQSIGGERSSASVNGELQRASTLSGGAYGSSHTSFKLQSPFHGPQSSSQPYTTIAIPPPPIIYDSVPQTSSSSSYIYPNGIRSYPDISMIPSISSPESSPPRRAFTNPLPEPPRQSPYRAPPLPASLSDPDAESSAEFWSKYAGVAATSH
ncbi:hypothetical protein EW146_g2449 [Bondarzewia mesenterica]|uniref:Uncharacterized protein n=1 Tax=Bondarzewia mesenterica TaxID=1095465 RepID=A0A4S4M142_9AGAM|nr:hypothetical protein EW146_g2449 [Bondarzewia mesenterica]